MDFLPFGTIQKKSFIARHLCLIIPACGLR